MYTLICGVFLAGLSMFGQTPGNPQAARLSLALSRTMVSAETADDSVNRALVDAMSAIATRERQPTRQQLGQLAEAFRGAAAGRDIRSAQMSALSGCVVNALSGAGPSNFALARQLRDGLAAIRVTDAKADLIVRRFMAVRESVRGPDDLPVSDNLK